MRMPKGFYVSASGRVYRATKPQLLGILKGLAKGEPKDVDGLAEVGPVEFDIDIIDADKAAQKYLEIVKRTELD